MALTSPLTPPSSPVFRRVTIRARSAVGVSISPFTFSQQVQAHNGGMWMAEVDLPPMNRAAAEDWIGFLLGLNGREHSFLMAADPVGRLPRGTWSGASPVVNGAHAANARTLQVRGLAEGTSWKRGDWLQLGSGTTPRLHKVTQDGSILGSPTAGYIELWPYLRGALVDGDAITIASPVGRWRLASNDRSWDLDLAEVYGIQFSCVEDLAF